MGGAARPEGLGWARVGGGEGAFAALALLLVGALVLPLPTWLLDLLLCANLGGSLALLLVSLSARGVTALGALPSLLLLSALARLSLNVASARLILLDGEAGRVIAAFGGLLVRGDFLVGLAIFGVLAVVQLLVLVKGAERIAEVAARFSLDALPGAQMSLDAELRAGLIGAQEARQRREALLRASRIYGAMDGAMKFVRGDAVAGLVIVAVNAVGGTALGALRRGMEVGEAAQLYGLLAVGDGLASQLPALLTTTAAGVLVSRVAAEQDHLGDDLIEQLGAHPRALGVAAAVLAVLGALPELPLAPMWALAGVFGGLAWAAGRSRAKAQGETASISSAGSALGLPEALLVSCHAQDLGRLEGLPARWEDARRRFALEDGVEVPALRVVAGRFEEEPGRASVALWELPALQTAWERPEEVAESVEQAVRHDLVSFVGAQAVQRKLDAIKAEAPEEVSAAVPKPVSLARLTSVVQRMVEERVPVRDLRPTLAVFAREAREDMRLDALVELGRQSQRRAISWRFGGPSKVVRAWTLDPEVEDMIRACIKDEVLSLPAGIRRDLMKLAQPLAGEAGAVVVTRPELRRHVRDILRAVQREVTVLSYAEFLPEVRLEAVGVLKPR